MLNVNVRPKYAYKELLPPLDSSDAAPEDGADRNWKNIENDGRETADKVNARLVMRTRQRVMTLMRSPPEWATRGAKKRPFTIPLKALLLAIASPRDCSDKWNTFLRTRGNVSESMELATDEIIFTLSSSHTIFTTPAIEVTCFIKDLSILSNEKLLFAFILFSDTRLDELSLPSLILPSRPRPSGESSSPLSMCRLSSISQLSLIFSWWEVPWFAVVEDMNSVSTTDRSEPAVAILAPK